ncbi:hypothetical protein [Hyphomicrobium sp. CS1GBMeth3]|uniref:hypothetical protein n=1 Tax=Hyphomicrobium sp. CS1GBMeth3 TaxID=1892845 RepID=UPI0009316B3F|nr:hypothetical protein [Hyphomicrobium sp. CS1GBMeth3]
MSFNDLVLLVLVGGAAFYAGYLIGRLKALAEVGARAPEENSPLPGPSLDGPYAEAGSAPRPRGAPPPASAGGGDGSRSSGGEGRTWSAPPRRSTKPPPAAAGLMGTGTADEPTGRQK